MLDTATYLPRLKQFEGAIPHMYLDTAGYVTVGVGTMLPNAAAAKKVTFVRCGAQPVPAGAEEIQADFDNVEKQTPGKMAAYYKKFTKLELAPGVIDDLLQKHVEEFLSSCRKLFPAYDQYSAEACAAIFDMGFNLGFTKLKSQFPSFCKAVRNNDWALAAKHCRRGGIGDVRNNWTKCQFEACLATAKSLL